ncbi:GDSL-like lipase/acylhydrolase family protein [Lachnoanaerobaculum saburreum F0468]|jgi:lipolytic enzyme, G-D-S-L|uniref:GDSL-like lipase/acylhydrolase family protein n=1 Tax=Lachnoanaerobaculum saburreum F0468 TaxID=1095750 RepID=I0R5H0_9FIRM|nr:GDSL-type esterase/lipase family protein [Lachnoanaerobaculum saburreum]EIC94928.1 GDSL-like lipase/acylhydrolase family protein [Lachnoanaerobaculum saburreum F0468]
MKKRIVIFGDSNTWGYDAKSGGRFNEEIRWPMVAAKILGDRYRVCEEGLCGRTTCLDDPFNEGLSGLNYLLPCLQSHSPLDMLVIMLGTNDCKERFSLTGANIALGMRRLVIKALGADVWRDKPNILIIAPGPILKECENSAVGSNMGRCSDKSYKLSMEYKFVADELKVGFFDAAPYVVMNDIDFMHLTADSHIALAKKVSEIIKETLENKEVKI